MALSGTDVVLLTIGSIIMMAALARVASVFHGTGNRKHRVH